MQGIGIRPTDMLYYYSLFYDTAGRLRLRHDNGEQTSHG
jgi:hypothetical protein